MAGLSDEVVRELLVEFVLAVRRSIPHGTIRPVDSWPRTQAALVTAVNRASSWSHFVSVVAAKLGVTVYAKRDAEVIAGIGEKLGDHGYDRVREIIDREAVYVIVECQAERDRERAGEGA